MINRFLRGKQRKAKAANDSRNPSSEKDGHKAEATKVANELKKVSSFHSYKYGEVPSRLVSLGFTLARVKLHVKQLKKIETKDTNLESIIRRLDNTADDMDQQITEILLQIKGELEGKDGHVGEGDEH